jgi:hypothetical protein
MPPRNTPTPPPATPARRFETVTFQGQAVAVGGEYLIASDPPGYIGVTRAGDVVAAEEPVAWAMSTNIAYVRHRAAAMGYGVFRVFPLGDHSDVMHFNRIDSSCPEYMP